MKTIEEIYQTMLDAFQERAGFRPEDSCDLSVRFYAAAAQIQALYLQADWVLNQSFPQTAQGIWLDYHAQTRGIHRMAATKSTGTIRFSIGFPSTTDLYIDEGAVCMTSNGIRFRTTAGVSLPAGSLTVDAPAESVESGSIQNVTAGAVHVLTACPVGITLCTNPIAFSGGTDAESDESLRARVLESYQRLPNGANAAWYQQTAMQHSGVVAAQVVGRARGIGTVDVYIAKETGLPSISLLQEVYNDLQDKREIAVNVQVYSPLTQNIDVSVKLTTRENVDFTTVKNQVDQVIRNFFNGKLLGKELRLAELGNLIYSVDGVENYKIIKPSTDQPAQVGLLPILGTLTISNAKD